MESEWATEQLKTIRTLMERAAVYRRALAPTTIAAGVIGIFAGLFGWTTPIASPEQFITYWLGIATLTLGKAFVLVRRQALNASEPFWSPPTKKVAQAIAPPLFAGLVVSLSVLSRVTRDESTAWKLVAIWMLLYGCALHSAGFFMQRGIRLFGWIYVLLGTATVAAIAWTESKGTLPQLRFAHAWMGFGFGMAHLCYGTYLKRTETAI